MRIVLCYPAEPQHIARIADVAPDAEIVDAGQEHVAEELFDADVFCGHAKVPVPWDDIVARGRLCWIHSTAAGLDHCLVPSVVNSEVHVSSSSGGLADQVAEQTLALLLGLCRGLPRFFRAQQRREFVRLPTRDLHRATVGILGLGGNGRKLAQVLHPFDVRILATDYFPFDCPGEVDALLPPEQTEEVLAQVDILILAAPLTEQTRGMIDARRLAAMPPGGLLINVARGPMVVENALVDALESGHLAGAGVDVTEAEPLPADSRLWDQPEVIITPHVGGQSARRIDDSTDLFCDNLHRWLAERPLLNHVDKQLGFPARRPGDWQHTHGRWLIPASDAK